MPYSTSDIRNIAFVGQAGAGKTLLAEALLAQSGAIKAKGSLARGTTVCDFDPQEKALLHSLDAAICGFESQGKRVNMIDTPGYPDFLGRTLCALEAVETAVVVVSAVNGVEPMTHRMMDFAKARGLCRLIVVNKIDSREARTEEVLEEIREAFGRACLPLNLPADNGAAVVDCFFQAKGKPTDFSSAEAAHTEIIDQVVEVDEKLMALYLEQGEEISPEQLHDPFEKALREDHLVPICFCSAETGVGIPELIQVLLKLAPNPAEGNPPPFLKGEGPDATRVSVNPDPAKHVIAHVFKVTIDPFVGKLGIFRVHQGTVKAGAQLFVGDARKPIKIAHLYQLQGKDHIEVPQAVPGDICAVPKIDELHFDAVLHDSHDEDHHHLKSVSFPPPMLGVAIRAEKRGEEQKLSESLHRMVAEDPCVRVDLHTAQMSPGTACGTSTCSLPCSWNRCAILMGLRASPTSSWAPAFTVPWCTRKMPSLPTNGSIETLNTCAMTCFDGSGSTLTRTASGPSPLRNGGGLPSVGFGASFSRTRVSSAMPAPVSAEQKQIGTRWSSRSAFSNGSCSCSGEISSPCSR